MNNTIKILLIAAMAAAIAGVIYYFTRDIEDDTTPIIAVTPTEKRVDSEVKSKIAGHNYAEAATAFDAIMGDIATESSVKDADGTLLMSVSEKRTCHKIAFYAFEPIFERYQKDYFERSSWSENELSALKSRAQSLLSMNIAEEKAKATLEAVVKNVDDYHAAWAVVRGTSSCATVAAVQGINSRLASYKRAPLTNNAALNSGMNSAYATAKQALASNIIARCRRVANGYHNYSSYQSFYSAVTDAMQSISEYVNAFGGESQFNDVRSELYRADSNAMNYNYPNQTD